MPDPIPASILAAAGTAIRDEGPLCARWDPLLPVLEYGCTHQSCLSVAVPESATPQRDWDLAWILADGASPVTPDECPKSHMDDGSHATDYEDSGCCPWCGEANPDWAGRGTAEGP